MPGAREDYLVRQIDLLRQFVARLVRDRRPAEIEQALLQSFALQERLMPRPPAEFLQLDAVGQFEALRRGLPAAAAAERCLTYAELLVHTGTLYDLRGREDLATGARQLALHLAALAAVELGDGPARATAAQIRALVPDDALHPPVRALLGRLDAAG
jgi:hypothetical protein